MLFALLYGHDDQVIAAAAACDQLPMGQDFWIDCHAAQIHPNQMFETAYLTVTDPMLQSQLLSLGIEDEIDQAALTMAVESGAAPNYERILGRAA